MAFRLIGLWTTVALLLVGCTSGKKKSGRKEICDKISDAYMAGNECQCKSGYTKFAQNGDQFRCTRRNDTTDCRRPGYFNQTLNKCVCSDRNITYDRNSNNPCGPSFDAGFGVTAQQLQQACTNVGQWNNGFCACTSGQQFNYFTTRCEPVSYYHTRDICRNGATYYGANQGVCVCQNSQALFHPSFGGCTTYMDTKVIDAMCTSIYGVQGLGGRCSCPQGKVWFRGSCLDLGNDIISSLPPQPPDLRCELQGMQWDLNERRCVNVWGSIGYGGIGGPSRPITCERHSLINDSRECVIIHGNTVEVTEFSRWGNSLPSFSGLAKEYFRDRCERFALDRGRWVAGIGEYNPNGGHPFYGECLCRSPHGVKYAAHRANRLGYEYCVALGTNSSYYTECEGFGIPDNILDKLGLSITIGNKGGTTIGISYQGCGTSFEGSYSR